jgi:protein LSM14
VNDVGSSPRLHKEKTKPTEVNYSEFEVSNPNELTTKPEEISRENVRNKTRKPRRVRAERDNDVVHQKGGKGKTGTDTSGTNQPDKNRSQKNLQKNNNDQDSKGSRKQNKLSVPNNEFDFESANAQFTKPDDSEIPFEPKYNKSSFFDDISSEIKDRTENEGYQFL